MNDFTRLMLDTAAADLCSFMLFLSSRGMTPSMDTWNLFTYRRDSLGMANGLNRHDNDFLFTGRSTYPDADAA